MVELHFDDDLNFISLPKYALFVLTEKLEEYVLEQIRLSRQLQLPILKFFDNMAEDDLIAFSKQTNSEFLQYFVDNRALNLIEDSIEQWRADELPHQIGRYQLCADDITLISFIRKQSLLKFLKQYSTDLDEVLRIVEEIDRYILMSDSIAFETFMSLMDEKLNQHVHFIEKIANTSPGIVYVYDLLENKQIYTNEKSRSVLGYDMQDIGNAEQITCRQMMHPEEESAVQENLDDLVKLGDGDIKIFEHRIKNKNDQFQWMREYQSVFKRDEAGRVTQIIGLSMNINGEKAMADELASREEQLLEAQTLADMGSFNWNLQKDESITTPQLRKILGMQDGANLPDFMARIHPYDKAQVEKAVDDGIKKTGHYDAEFRFLGADDDSEKILWSKGMVSYHDGQPVSMKGTVMDVTERHHMIQKLKHSEELYKQAQALTHIGNWTLEIPSNRITWTDELFRIVGLEPQSVNIQLNDIINYLHPRDKDEFAATISQLQNLSSSQEYFPRIVLKDGTVKILNVKAEVVKDEHGIIYKIIGTAQDITEQKLNEKKLRENQNFIQKITDATPSIIAAYNINTGKYTFINQAFEKILGYPTSKLLEEGAAFVTNLVHPDDLPKIMKENAEAVEFANGNLGQSTNDLVVDFKYRLLNKNGQYRWFHTFGTIFDRNEKKQVEHVLNISIDITDRIAAEEKVKEQEHFIQRIADASPTVLYLFDIEKGSIVYINQEIELLLGYTPEEIIEYGPLIKSVLFHPEDVGKVGQHVEEHENADAFKEYECRVHEKHGNWRTLLIREIGFKKNEEGKYVQVLCAALDITDRKLIENTLYHKTMELQQSNSSLEEFAYVASHDLKEPLRKITTFGDRLLLKEKTTLQEDSFKYLQKIIESSERMQRMIDDLLSISMISVEKTLENFDLQVILSEVLQTLEFKIEESKAVIKADKLPTVNIIPSQFRQLFQNFLSNSLKFEREGVPPVIQVKHKFLNPAEIEQEGLNRSIRYLQLQFIDNGIGFDEKYSEKIFAIFHRLHGKSEYEGTGIGLAICKKIVENHSGKISASSKENEGATFTVIIPA